MKHQNFQGQLQQLLTGQTTQFSTSNQQCQSTKITSNIKLY